MHPAESDHPRPFARAFYERLAGALAGTGKRDRRILDQPGAHILDVCAGEVFRVTLLDGPQIVNMFLHNPNDPDERLWAHQTLLIESIFLRRFGRLWGTMARFRPLATVLEDTVVTLPTRGAAGARHHPIYGDWGTRADWHYLEGPEGVMTSWEQLVAGFEARGLSPSLLMDYPCLFQKTAVDGPSQLFDILPSDAVDGDAIAFFAELDLTVMFALSPLLDGARSPRELAGANVKPVEVSVSDRLAHPLEWPYEGMGYPDLSRYLAEDGRRSADVLPPSTSEAR